MVKWIAAGGGPGGLRGGSGIHESNDMCFHKCLVKLCEKGAYLIAQFSHRQNVAHRVL